MKEAVYEYASFFYDLYMDSGDDGIIESGQNNATQFDINQFISISGGFFRLCIGLVQEAPSHTRKVVL